MSGIRSRRNLDTTLRGEKGEEKGERCTRTRVEFVFPSLLQIGGKEGEKKRKRRGWIAKADVSTEAYPVLHHSLGEEKGKGGGRRGWAVAPPDVPRWSPYHCSRARVSEKKGGGGRRQGRRGARTTRELLNLAILPNRQHSLSGGEKKKKREEIRCVAKGGGGGWPRIWDRKGK